MSYRLMAQVYDQLMADAPYDLWVAFTRQMISRFNPDVKSILDAGCGTGEITHRLDGKGFSMTGVDLSEEMLTIAQQKNPAADIQWIHQDITRLDGFAGLDCIISYCDVMNYVTDEESVKNAFSRAYNTLNDAGLFIFDVHSIEHIQHDLYGQTFAEVYDDVSYIWFCDPGESENSVTHDLTFFVQEGEKYQRFDEQHFQRGYTIDALKKWLSEAGFNINLISSDFSLESSSTGDRIFFVCQK
ncbi:class I SAM-dependent methyltransferase [Halobacillus yeomjeoni]|uniref:class I SAM-dependent DNA methyltransferase n=1 Tax=Halobacillus yeomjeoni TaxID=311194 RepID=UPI001CD55C5F|nr:class I SAM-dependent methyltransferase [Halobacillus yeomjeoni]MCA0982682.1 class I SAM-dependent methyltransferase [Halobacillus yeomjeoni]